MKQRTKANFKIELKLKNDNKHYCYNKFYSYPHIFMGMIDGGRGIGKTTTFLMKALRNTENNEEFIYLRRYKPEIKKFVNKNSFSPIVDNILYQGDGTGGYNVLLGKKQLGYLISLSTARSYKSTDFSKVSLIIFDEAFVRQTASYRYLQDEVIQFLEFLSTVIRTRTNVKVVLLGNNEDIFSPYHSYFNIPIFKGIYIDAEHSIYCEHAKNSEALLEDEKKTGLYSLIKDTSYGSYHYDNELLGEEKVDIINKPVDAKLLMRLIVNNQMLNIYTYLGVNKEVNLYCEHKEKIVKDNISYELVTDNKYNYFNIDLYKKRLKNYIYRFYFHNLVHYNTNKGGAILTWIIENI